MKFKGTPNMLIRDIHKRKVYRFDENGFFETDNESIIRRMSGKFKTAGDNQADYAQAGPAITQELPVTVTNAPEGFICPQCGKVCKNASGLSAHLRTCKGA